MINSVSSFNGGQNYQVNNKLQSNNSLSNSGINTQDTFTASTMKSPFGKTYGPAQKGGGTMKSPFGADYGPA